MPAGSWLTPGWLLAALSWLLAPLAGFFNWVPWMAPGRIWLLLARSWLAPLGWLPAGLWLLLGWLPAALDLDLFVEEREQAAWEWGGRRACCEQREANESKPHIVSVLRLCTVPGAPPGLWGRAPRPPLCWLPTHSIGRSQRRISPTRPSGPLPGDKLAASATPLTAVLAKMQ